MALRLIESFHEEGRAVRIAMAVWVLLLALFAGLIVLKQTFA